MFHVKHLSAGTPPFERGQAPARRYSRMNASRADVVSPPPQSRGEGPTPHAATLDLDLDLTIDLDLDLNLETMSGCRHDRANQRSRPGVGSRYLVREGQCRLSADEEQCRPSVHGSITAVGRRSRPAVRVGSRRGEDRPDAPIQRSSRCRTATTYRPPYRRCHPAAIRDPGDEMTGPEPHPGIENTG